MKKISLGFYIEFGSSFTGGPRNLYNLVRELDRDRFEPIVVTNMHSPLTEALVKLDVEPIILEQPASIGSDDGLALRGGIGAKLKAWRELRRYNQRIQKVFELHNVRAIWTRNIKGVLLTQRAARAMNVPMVWDIGMEKTSRGVMWALHVLGFRRAARVVTEGDFVARSIFTPWQLKTFKDKLVSNPTGVPSDRVDRIARESGHGPPPYDPFVVLNVATINPRKNQLMLLRAVAALASKHPNLRVWFAGPVTDEVYDQEIQAYVAENQIEDRLSFLGWQDDVGSLLHKAHLFALTSHIEGVAQAVLEAVHAHTPILSTACGGIPEVVRDGETGRLVPIDDLEAFTQALDDCLSNPERLAGYADAAKKLVHSRFMADLWYERYEKLFEELCGLDQAGVA